MPKDRRVFPSPAGFPLPGWIEIHHIATNSIGVGNQPTVRFEAGHYVHFYGGRFDIDIAQGVQTERWFGYNIGVGEKVIWNYRADQGISSGLGIPTITMVLMPGISERADISTSFMLCPVPDVWLPPGAFFQFNTFGFNNLDNIRDGELYYALLDYERYQDKYGFDLGA